MNGWAGRRRTTSGIKNASNCVVFTISQFHWFWRNVMKRFANLFAVIATISFVVLGTAGLADAQRRNERQIRDLVRSLNAQIDDFQYGLDYQLRSNSSRSQDIENVHESIRK